MTDDSTSHSIHKSLHRGAFPVNRLHLYWQAKLSNLQITCIQNSKIHTRLLWDKHTQSYQKATKPWFSQFYTISPRYQKPVWFHQLKDRRGLCTCDAAACKCPSSVRTVGLTSSSNTEWFPGEVGTMVSHHYTCLTESLKWNNTNCPTLMYHKEWNSPILKKFQLLFTAAFCITLSHWCISISMLTIWSKSALKIELNQHKIINTYDIKLILN